MEVLLLAIALQAAAGTAALFVSSAPRAATVLGVAGAFSGAALGLVPTLHVLATGTPESWRGSWDAAHGAFVAAIDPLSAFFLLPVLGLSALASLYGGDYLLGDRSRKPIGSAWFFYNLFVAGMALVLVARTAFLFLVAWEVMSVAAYFLVTYDQEKAEVRRAGWIYLVAAHLGVAFLFLAFVLLGRNAGSLEFAAFREATAPTAGWAGLIFVLAAVGFGTKAGLVPLHVWLPEAHPVAPSHVSALMSGVMIKMGFYGILRVLTFLGPPAAWWGPLLAGFGLLTALAGIALALQQRDVKRVLAYSSIENVGLIALALGVGLWGLATGRPAVAVLGMTAGLLHIWNHSLMKGLLFLAAGSILHGTGTKDMEKLGGLMKRMPWTSGAMVVGAVAIAALPPLNGFASKWLIYLAVLTCGLSMTDSACLPALFAAGVLAFVGGLAAVTFVRLIGVVLLGSPRSEAAEHAHEASLWMRGPLFVLIVLCIGAAIFPLTLAEWLSGARNQVLEAALTAATIPPATNAPLDVIGQVNGWTLAVIAVGVMGLLAWSRQAGLGEGPTWGCGYVKPTPRMQYTGRSFAELLAERLLPRFLRPHTRRHAPHGLFPTKSDFTSVSPDPVATKVYEPFFRYWAERFARLRILQQGIVHVYLLYIGVVVVLALTWVSVRPWVTP